MNIEKFKNWVSNNYKIEETDIYIYIYMKIMKKLYL